MAQVPEDAAKRIKSIRTQYGLRQQELADRLGVTQITISRWEQGRSTPQPAYWRRIELAEKKGLKWLTESEEWAMVQKPNNTSATRDFLANSERCWAYLEAQRLAASIRSIQHSPKNHPLLTLSLTKILPCTSI